MAGLEVDRAALDSETHALDVMGEIVDRDHCSDEIAHRDFARVGVFLDIGLDGHVALQRRRAGEDEAVVALEIHQGEGRGLAMIDFAVQHLRLAGAAEAMSAGMWKIDAGAKTGVEDGLALLDLDRFAQGINRQLMHGHDTLFS